VPQDVLTARTLAILCVVASAVIATALAADVDGYVLPPALRFWLTVALPGLTALASVLPPLRRRPT
jgi:hypothetical protein